MRSPLSLIAALALCLPLVAQAATSVNERHPLGAGGRVEISNIAGKVTVRGWDRNDVALTGSMADGLTLKQDRSSNRVRWEVEYPRGRSNRGATLELRVPHAVDVQLGTVSADIDVADIDVRRLQANSVSGSITAAGRSGETTLNTVSGGIRSQVQTPRLDARTVSGQLLAGGGASGEVAAESVSGRVNVTAGRIQRLAVETVSGSLDVSATGMAPGGKVTMQTVSGSVALKLPVNVSAQLNVKTFSGGIQSDAGQVEKPRYGPGSSLDARLGSGDGDISINSHSGSVRVSLGR